MKGRFSIFVYKQLNHAQLFSHNNNFFYYKRRDIKGCAYLSLYPQYT